MIAKSLIYWKENYFGCWFPFQTFLINKKYFGWLMILTVLSDQYHSRICRLIFTCLIWGSGKRKGLWKLIQNFIENSLHPSLDFIEKKLQRCINFFNKTWWQQSDNFGWWIYKIKQKQDLIIPKIISQRNKTCLQQLKFINGQIKQIAAFIF